jgi:hypothetical protein
MTVINPLSNCPMTLSRSQHSDGALHWAFRSHVACCSRWVAGNAVFIRKCFSEPLPSNPSIKDLRALRKNKLSKRGVSNRHSSLSGMVEGLTLSDYPRQGAIELLNRRRWGLEGW